MPTYQVECTACEAKESRRLTFAEYDQVKDGTKGLQCTVCSEPAKLGFAPGTLGFILKEGPSGGWATKSIKEKQYRKNRHGVMGRRQKDHVKVSKLQPNFKGQETGTWKEAQEVARSTDGNLAASTYDRLVSKEKAK